MTNLFHEKDPFLFFESFSLLVWKEISILPFNYHHYCIEGGPKTPLKIPMYKKVCIYDNSESIPCKLSNWSILRGGLASPNQFILFFPFSPPLQIIGVSGDDPAIILLWNHQCWNIGPISEMVRNSNLSPKLVRIRYTFSWKVRIDISFESCVNICIKIARN